MDTDDAQQASEFTEAQRELIAKSAGFLADRIRRPLRLTTGTSEGREWARIALASGTREGAQTLVVLHCTGEAGCPWVIYGPDDSPMMVADPGLGKGLPHVALTGLTFKAMRRAEDIAKVRKDAKSRDATIRAAAAAELQRLADAPLLDCPLFDATLYAVEWAGFKVFHGILTRTGQARRRERLGLTAEAPRVAPAPVSQPVQVVAATAPRVPMHLVDPHGFTWHTFDGAELDRLDDPEFFMRIAWGLNDAAVMFVIGPGLQGRWTLAARNGSQIKWLPVGQRVQKRIARAPLTPLIELLRMARGELHAAGWRLTAIARHGEDHRP